MGLSRSSVGKACLSQERKQSKRRDLPVLALAGHPNVGKSSIFNALTGLRQHTGNWPGKTVSKAEGLCRCEEKDFLLVDLPGIYSLAGASAEEQIARDSLLSGEIEGIVLVCDGGCIQRDLPLVLQAKSLGLPMLLCVNLLDQAEKKGIHIDLLKLEELLEVPVIGTIARDKDCGERIKARLESLDWNAPARPRTEMKEAEALAAESAAICCEAVLSDGSGYGRFDRAVDKMLWGRLLGWLLMAGLLALVFYITIRGANLPSELLSRGLFWLEGRLRLLMEGLGCPPWLLGLLLDGAYRSLAWVVAVMLPPMAIFFPLFTILEDSGYLPRVAFCLDGPFCRCGSCGRQALTMAMGFGCNAAGVVGCRMISSRRERLMAILTNSLVPCNGRFPGMIAVLGIFLGGSWGAGAGALGLTGLVILAVALSLGSCWILSHTILKGESSYFVLELPPYRAPRWGQVLCRSLLDRTLFVLGRAAAVAAPAGALLWILGTVQLGGESLLSHLSAALEPLGKLLGMDGCLLLAFVLGLPANELVLPLAVMIYSGAGSLSPVEDLAALGPLLTSRGWTWITALCFLFFSMAHWPCSTTLLTIKKETGSWKWVFLAAVLPSLWGAALCLVTKAVAALTGA